MLPTRLTIPLGLAGTALLLAGCSSSVPASEIESAIESRVPGSSASCPEELAGKEGETITCDVKVGEFSTTADVKVTAVGGKNGSNIVYGFELADEPPAE